VVTVVEQIERILSLSILRGELAVGSRLPGLRALAVTHGVTPPTVQRVIARLEAKQLVEARQGHGVTVLDPEAAGLALLPLWFEVYRDQPDRACAVLTDFLELRRVVAVHLMGSRWLSPDPELMTLVADLYEADTVAERARLDLAFTRRVLEVRGNLAARALFDSARRLVTEVPLLAEALYGDAEDHRRVLTALGSALGDARVMDRELTAWDARSVQRYRALMTGA
jgi:DNA-binding FadR family transcriptional regulator